MKTNILSTKSKDTSRNVVYNNILYIWQWTIIIASIPHCYNL